MNDDPLPDVSGDWLAAMRRGDFEAAWQATDRIELPRRARQREPGLRHRPEFLRWDGTPLAGRCVMVRCEHGLGDTLQFMRFVPHLRAARVHFMVQPPLVDLLRGAPGLGEVRNWWADAPLPAHDVDIEVMELAYALRSTVATLPPPYPHLRAQLPRHADFGIADEGRLRVGLLWSVSDWGQDRSIALQELAPLFAIEEAQFFSLQQGQAASDPLLQRLDVECLSPRTTKITLAAAAMCQLDLVICTDSMPGHLAGTLGLPTWMLLKHEADWRWMSGRDDSPWYPGVRLFRQPRPGDWRDLAQQVASSLRVLAQAHRRRQLSAAAPAR